MKTKPRNNAASKLTGVFSTRSPDRPNPIGIHFVTVILVLNKNEFMVSGPEVLDQTPLIDIKTQLNKTRFKATTNRFHWAHQKLQVLYNIPVAPANGDRYSINFYHFGRI